jgi:hypothetical protein
VRGPEARVGQTYSIRQTAWAPTPTPVALGARAAGPLQANILDTADSLGAYPDTSCPGCAGLWPASGKHTRYGRQLGRLPRHQLPWVRGPPASFRQTYSIRQTAWAPTPTPVALGARAFGPRCTVPVKSLKLGCAGRWPASGKHTRYGRRLGRLPRHRLPWVRGPEARVGQTYSIRQTAWTPTPTPVALGARASGPRRAVHGRNPSDGASAPHHPTLALASGVGGEITPTIPYQVG